MKTYVSTGDAKTDAMTRELIERLSLPYDIFLCVIAEGLHPPDGASHIIVLYKSADYLSSKQHAELSEQSGKSYAFVKYPYVIEEFLKTCFSLTHDHAGFKSPNEAIDIDAQARKITYKDNVVHLTATEFALFKTLYDNRGQTVDKNYLTQSVWKTSKSTNILEVYIAYLRKKLSAVFGEGVITGIRNHGYMLSLP